MVDGVVYIVALQTRSRQLVVGWRFQSSGVPAFHNRSVCEVVDTIVSAVLPSTLWSYP